MKSSKSKNYFLIIAGILIILFRLVIFLSGKGDLSEIIWILGAVMIILVGMGYSMKK